MNARGVIVRALVLCVAAGLFSAWSGSALTAEAAIAWPETITGLPDGRIYEEVSPANKHGAEVFYARPAFVAPDGESVMYGATGALAAESSNATFEPAFVSRRTSNGWVTRSVLPLPAAGETNEEENIGLNARTTLIDPSSDLSQVVFGSYGHVAYVGSPDKKGFANNIFLEGTNPFAEPEWVGRSQIEGAPEGTEQPTFNHLTLAGASPDLKTIYFSYASTLLPGASHLYEYREGVLSDAGVLPNGETGHGVAAPAAQPEAETGTSDGPSRLRAPASYDNQVSADGSTIFFTREDEAGTLELYARVTAADGSQGTVLVSQSQLPGHVGEPAPDGPSASASTDAMAQSPLHAEHSLGHNPPSYVYASPDGLHAFFQTTDRLTTSAPEDGAVKTYDFDLGSGTLEYLPGLTGSIVTVSNDGSSLIFENTAASPFELERWTAGAAGGSVVPIAQLPSVARNACETVLCVGPAYTSDDGNVVVFATESPTPGFNDGGSHYQRTEVFNGEGPETSRGLLPNIEIFRYDAQRSEVTCVSCPPAGVAPSSDAIVSMLDFENNVAQATAWTEVITPGRSMSADGRRVFFQTRDALVPQDTNGKPDVYEWEEGHIYLISSGRSTEPSYLAGTSESGDDVFVMTSEGIAPGDRDGSYDVYDARVPRPGDFPPPEAVPCEGAVCQGPPSVPQLLGAPASEAFNGAGNLTPPPPAARVTGKALPRAQALARALKACKRRKSSGKRKRCERKARHRYAAKTAKVHPIDGQGRRGNGRSK